MNAYVKNMFSGLALVVVLFAFSCPVQAQDEQPERMDVTGKVAFVQITNWTTPIAAIFSLFIEDSEGNTIQSPPFLIVRGVTTYMRGDEVVDLWRRPIDGPFINDRLHVVYTPDPIGIFGFQIIDSVVTDN